MKQDSAGKSLWKLGTEEVILDSPTSQRVSRFSRWRFRDSSSSTLTRLVYSRKRNSSPRMLHNLKKMLHNPKKMTHNLKKIPTSKDSLIRTRK